MSALAGAQVAPRLTVCLGVRATRPRRLQATADATGSGETRAEPNPRSPPPPPPAVGWLWDKKSGDTARRLAEQKLRPKKSLGQNFMLDDSVLAAIVEAAGIEPGDLVLEIGPGTGNLTRHLLVAGALVTAVEKDYALSDQLEAEFAQVPELRLVCGDILRQDLGALLEGMRRHPAELAAAQAAAAAQRQLAAAGAGGAAASGEVAQHAAAASTAAGQQQPGEQQQAGQQQAEQARPAARRKVKVVANLPYYITKDCLLCMLPTGADIEAVYFMLQDEVGVRLTQEDPGASDWRAMNLLTQYYSQPRYLFQIDRKKYLPAPKVHGAAVAFDLLPPEARLHVPSEAEFLKLVKKAFSQRRKVVRNALRPMHEPGEVAAALQAAGLPTETRAQDLTLQQFATLAWALAKGGGSGGSDGSDGSSGSSGCAVDK